MRSNGLVLSLTGDCLITRRIAIYTDDATSELIHLIHDSDVAFTNLEVLPNNFRGFPAVEAGGAHLGCHEWVLDELIEMGFNLFACANNHSLDFSIEGLLATIEVLDERGVAYAGIGANLAESRMPVYFDTPTGSVAMISCASTFATGQEAGEQRPDFVGRPGLNPLRFDTIYDVSPQHLEAVKAMADELGVEEQRQERIRRGFGFEPEDPEIFPFLDLSFRASDQPGVRRTPKSKDMEAIARWVEEASQRADLVIVSLHAHEQGAGREEPADFIQEFAHRVIDAGADVVAGHGPHLLRGIELYRGKPIFYSLGNFVGQNELLYKLPADTYERFRIDPTATPGEMFRIRSQNDTRGFPADVRYWQSVMPVCRYDEAFELSEVEIVPITLSLGEANHRRGRPKLARGDEASGILERLAALSAPFGTRIDVADRRGHIPLDGSPRKLTPKSRSC
jgi:poly-gamma-glutamate capsule biosynthesis protein CapA/YwtB (metallophosphatase superfamily)